MDQSKNDIQQQFKDIVSKLPEDKRNALYQRLKEMDSESRNKTMEAIVKKDQESRAAKKASVGQPKAAPAGKRPVQKGQQKNPAAAKRPQGQAQKSGKPQPQQAKKPQPQKKAQPQSKVQPKAKAKEQPKKQVKPAPKQQKPAAKQAPVKVAPVAEIPVTEKLVAEAPKIKEKSGNAGKIIAIVCAVAVIAVIGDTCFIFRDSIKKMWNNITGSTTAATTEVTDTSDPTANTEQTADITSVTSASDDTSVSVTSDEPSVTPIPLASNAPDLSGMTIVLDPGHQEFTSDTTERVATWMSAEKPRCTKGGVGVTTDIKEYELTLDFSLKLKSYLEQCGANVIITRTVNDIDLSNQERANMATSANCDLFLRIHADSANDSKVTGIQMYVPNQGKFYSGDKSRASTLGTALSEATGLTFNGVIATEVYTGLNYATSVHTVQVSLGYLSNSDDEAVITNEEMQYNMIKCFAQFCAEYK